MTGRFNIESGAVRLVVGATFTALALLTGCDGNPAASPSDGARVTTSSDEPVIQLAFASPEDAAAAVRHAAATNDRAYMQEIFGPEVALLSSGDPAVDAWERRRFTLAADKRYDVVRDGGDRATIVVGDAAVPFPVPLVRVEGEWFFDTHAGIEEIFNLRVGANELATIAFLRAIPDAQREFAATDWNGDGHTPFATRLLSRPDEFDGLYWRPAFDRPVAPLGPYAAEGDADRRPLGALGYNGYFFRCLTKQGPTAPGGARDWMRDGRLENGFAFIATPAIYGDTGVMTFLVGADGVVREQDLGPDTEERAAEINTFDPMNGWSVVTD